MCHRSSNPRDSAQKHVGNPMQPLRWCMAGLLLAQACCTRSSPFDWMAAGSTVLLGAVSTWLFHVMESASRSSGGRWSFAFLVGGGCVICSFALLRLLASQWGLLLPMEEPTGVLEISKGILLGAFIFLIRHLIGTTNSRPTILGGGAWLNTACREKTKVRFIEVSEDDESLGAEDFDNQHSHLARDHPLSTIEEVLSASESSRITNESHEESLPDENDTFSKQKHNNPQTKSLSVNEDNSSSHSVETSREAREDSENPSALTAGSKCISPGLDDDKDDPLELFRQFLSEDKAKLTSTQQPQQERNSRGRSGKKDKERRSRDAQDKNGRTAVPLSTSMSKNDSIACSGSSRSFQKTTFDEARNQSQAYNNEKATRSSKSNAPSSMNRKGTRELRSVRFADEDGKDIEIVHDSNLCAYKRVLVLLMLPKEQVFEFVGLEYYTGVPDRDPAMDENENEQREAIRISQILEQLPSMASDPIMAKGRFVRLMRWDSNAEQTNELINALPIQSYGLTNDEVLVAVPKGYPPQRIMESSRTVLKNQKIMRTLRRNQGFCKSFPRLESLE